MIILGVDPGLRTTGYGVIENAVGRIKLVETGIIQPSVKGLLPDRLDSVYQNLLKILESHQPMVMILEKLYAHYKHPTTACLLGHVRGVICLLCAHRGIRLVEYGVKRIRKALTGNGNASKLQVRSVVANILKVNEEKLTLDASDALALALGHLNVERGLRVSSTIALAGLKK